MCVFFIDWCAKCELLGLVPLDTFMALVFTPKRGRSHTEDRRLTCGSSHVLSFSIKFSTRNWTKQHRTIYFKKFKYFWCKNDETQKRITWNNLSSLDVALEMNCSSPAVPSYLSFTCKCTLWLVIVAWKPLSHLICIFRQILNVRHNKPNSDDF